MENKYSPLIFRYGYMAMVMLLKEYEEIEKYEECAEIESALINHEKICGLNIPREVSEDAIEDYRTNFWRIGYSGDIAINNLSSYFSNLKKEVNHL